MECAGQVEIDPYCQAVLAKHWPTVKRMGDIREVKGTEFGAVDLICGGFPCQPFSLAGKRGGAEDDRYLWPEMLRIIKACRPAWVLGENVAGIIGVELDKVLAELESEGYELQPFIIPACAVDAPHERKRVWIIARRRQAVVDDTQGRGCGFPFSENFGQVERNVNTPSDAGQTLADTSLMRVERIGESRFGQPSGLVEEIVSDRSCKGARAAQWEPEPDVGRLADGVSNRVAMLRALGNAVVPQVVEEIGRVIMQAEECARGTRGRAGEHHATQQGQNTGNAVGS